MRNVYHTCVKMLYNIIELGFKIQIKENDHKMLNGARF